MSISYEGIGQWCATFACEGVREGTTVKVSANGTVSACAADEKFCGVVAAVGRDGKACSVQLGGLASVKYSGETPTAGYCTLAADGDGGVKVSESGRERPVVAVDTAAKTVTIVL